MTDGLTSRNGLPSNFAKAFAVRGKVALHLRSRHSSNDSEPAVYRPRRPTAKRGGASSCRVFGETLARCWSRRLLRITPHQQQLGGKGPCAGLPLLVSGAFCSQPCPHRWALACQASLGAAHQTFAAAFPRPTARSASTRPAGPQRLIGPRPPLSLGKRPPP